MSLYGNRWLGFSRQENIFSLLFLGLIFSMIYDRYLDRSQFTLVFDYWRRRKSLISVIWVQKEKQWE